MTLNEVLQSLGAAGTEENRILFQRHGAKPPLFGVSVADLRKLKRAIGPNQQLANELWDTAIPDARHLAIYLAVPKTMPATTIEAWVSSIDYYYLADQFVRDLVMKSPHADNCLKWTRSKKEWPGRAGYMLLALLLNAGEPFSMDRLRAFIHDIELEIHASRNRVRDAMLHALVAIGRNQPTLRREVIAAAHTIGRVDVDHGQTKCRTPDVLAELQTHLRSNPA